MPMVVFVSGGMDIGMASEGSCNFLSTMKNDCGFGIRLSGFSGTWVTLAIVLCSGGLFAAPSESYMCYKPTAGLSDYPWEKTGWWFDSTGSVPTLNRVPTKDDIVFLYSSKNNVLNGMPPMRIGSGIRAETGKLIVCDKDNGPSYQIGIRVEKGGEMVNYGDVIIGSGDSATKNAGGGFLEVEDGGRWTAYRNFSLGVSPRSSALVVKAGGIFSCTNGEFMVGREFGAACVTNAGEMVLKDFFVGGGSGEVVLNGSARVTNDVMKIEVGGLGASSLTLNGSSRLSAVTNLSLSAEEKGSKTSLRLRGGTIEMRAVESQSEYQLVLGSKTSADRVEVRGWGEFASAESNPWPQMLRLTPYGRVVADGEGEARDLDFSIFRTVGQQLTNYNPGSGSSNGWYAVNGGRLLFPAQQNFDNTRSACCVGQHPWASAPNLVNAFKVDFTRDANGTTGYFHAELHAADRTEIPAGLGDGFIQTRRVQGVWRIGFFNSRTVEGRGPRNSWSDAKVTFRYDSTGLEEGWMVKLLHHDGTEKGCWRTVGQCVHDPANCLISDASVRQPGSDTYNFGWYAVVAYRKSGLLIVVY